MAHRTFQDAAGIEWQAWEVYPALAERRAARERRVQLRSDRPRRQRHAPRVGVHDELREGWLAFQGGGDRRRLSPIPRDWTSLTDRGLRLLLNSTVPTGKQRRLVD